MPFSGNSVTLYISAISQKLIEVEQGKLLRTLPIFRPDFFLSMEINVEKHMKGARGIFTLIVLLLIETLTLLLFEFRIERPALN